MTLYKDNRTRSLKWLVALIVFVLALTVTWVDVYGDQKSNVSEWNINNGPTYDTPAQDKGGAVGVNERGGDNPTTPVPEPTTLLLLGGGLTALYVARRYRKNTK